MSERGGPTTQSGILYQNSVAALYLGRLCDATQRPDHRNVTQVRVESPDEVDDIVVTFADGHKLFIQAKENIASGDNAWNKVWNDFYKQFQNETFQQTRDQLCLQIGNLRDEHDKLSELCLRASTSNNFDEWQGRLTNDQKALLEKIKPNLSPILLGEDGLLNFFSRVIVQKWPLTHIEQDLVPFWMPETTKSKHELFRLFRDRVEGEARIRGSFTAQKLRKSLESEDQSLLFVTPTEIDDIRNAIKDVGSLLRHHKHTIGDTDYHIERPIVEEIVNWVQSDDDSNKNVSILVDQAGMGKSVVLHDVLFELEKQGVDTLAIKADRQQISEVTSISDISEKLEFPFPLLESLQRLAKLGRVVVLIDQVDALSLTLTHDQKALNTILNLIAHLRQIQNLRIVLSCRLFDRKSDPNLKQIEVDRQFTPNEIAEDEIKNALSCVSVEHETLANPTKKLLQTPLHLELFVQAVENDPQSIDTLRNISSLQELYRLIWQNIVLKSGTNFPTQTDRVKVIYLLTDYMDRNQKASTPHTLFQEPQYARLESALNWLASHGILIRGKTEWTFFHQTFFDYCYGSRFVEQGKDIVKTILSSDQGILWRAKLIQVLMHLRGSDPAQYLRTLQRLFENPNHFYRFFAFLYQLLSKLISKRQLRLLKQLQHRFGLRYHLQDLVFRWFGALPQPSDNEWVIAKRMFLDPTKQAMVLRSMYGNTDWFQKLSVELLPGWLSKNDDADTLAFPYLESMIDVAQAQVVHLIRPYWDRSEQWNERIFNLVPSIRNWHTIEAIELFEQIVYKRFSFVRRDLYQLAIVAEAHPPTGCKLLLFVLDQLLEDYLTKRDQETQTLGENYAFSTSTTTLYGLLSSLDNSHLEKSFQTISKAEPKLFIETMMPWLERAVSSRGLPENEPEDRFIWDELSGNWYENVFRTRHAIIHGFKDALIEIATSEPEYFNQVTSQLADLPYETPQQLLTHVYRAVPKEYATDACNFLLSDIRRLNLGDSAQYDSRQLIRAIYPYLSQNHRGELERYILSYAPIYKSFGVEGLQRRGIEQLRILQEIPKELLSHTAIRRLREWERKFPDYKVPEDPITTRRGFVESPIPLHIAQKMSNRNWLWAMQKYQGPVRHRDFLKGGGDQLSRVLSELIKDNSDRFYQLVPQLPDTIDDVYVIAFIEGFAESNAPAEWLFEIIRRFSSQNDRSIERPIARALQKRVNDNIPEDIINLLRGYLNKPMGQDERLTATSSNDQFNKYFHHYLNSDRGSAFMTLMRVFDQQKGERPLQNKWELIEYTASDDSDALRVGAIHELTYMIQHNRNRALDLFEKLLQDHEELLESQYVREFLYWAFNKNFLRLQSYFKAMMNHKSENVQEQGAQLACIAAISTEAMESKEALKAAQNLASQALKGSLPWRRGAARIYAHNITGNSMGVCLPKVVTLLKEKDEQIQNYIGGIFFQLRADHFFTLRKFFNSYAHSGIALEHKFAEYLWENGLLDTRWTLSTIWLILEKSKKKQSRWISGMEELIRLVLRIYTDPTSDKKLQEETMDVFDLLMERYAGHALKVLSEWDER